MRENETMSNHHDKPPVFKTWPGWYAFVILFLLFQIAVYYFLTLHFQ